MRRSHLTINGSTQALNFCRIAAVIKIPFSQYAKLNYVGIASCLRYCDTFLDMIRRVWMDSGWYTVVGAGKQEVISAIRIVQLVMFKNFSLDIGPQRASGGLSRTWMGQALCTRSPYSPFHLAIAKRPKPPNRPCHSCSQHPIPRYGEDNIGADAGHIMEIRVTQRRILHGCIAKGGGAHTPLRHAESFLARNAYRNRDLRQSRSFSFGYRLCTAWVYHRRYYEELARTRDFFGSVCGTLYS